MNYGRSAWLWLAGAGLVTIPGVLTRFEVFAFPYLIAALLFGLTICGAAFLISWSAEAAEKHIGHGLIIGIIALIVVLPEYAIDMAFSWKAGEDFATYGSYPIANMTGANRLLVGLGWPFAFGIYWWKTRSSALVLGSNQALELVTIGAASLYACFIAIKGNLAFYDTLVLGGIFLAYILILSRVKEEGEAEPFGPAALLASIARPFNYIVFGLIFFLAGAVIFLVADPFGESLIHVGSSLGVDPFLLVQWVAPLASELPEFIVAGLLVWRISAQMGMATLISSKVNQWTLLVGSIPVVFMISQGSMDPFPFDARQKEEILLTAAQSLFAVVLLSRLRLSLWGSLALISLFSIQFAFPSTHVRYILSFVYLGLGALFVVFDRARMVNLGREAYRAFRKLKKAS